MKEAPIIMSGNHPKLIQDLKKTQTRRLTGLDKINESPDKWELITTVEEWEGKLEKIAAVFFPFGNHNDGWSEVAFCPYGQVGDRLGVKETHYRFGHWKLTGEETSTGKEEYEFEPLSDEVKYFDNPPDEVWKGRVATGWYKRPSIFLPKKYIRIWLEITEVRVERVQEITNKDAEAEGSDFWWNAADGFKELSPTSSEFASDNVPIEKRDYIKGFEILWDSLNAKRGYSWASNPWVWVISFREIPIG